MRTTDDPGPQLPQDGAGPVDVAAERGIEAIDSALGLQSEHRAQVDIRPVSDRPAQGVPEDVVEDLEHGSGAARIVLVALDRLVDPPASMLRRHARAGREIGAERGVAAVEGAQLLVRDVPVLATEDVFEALTEQLDAEISAESPWVGLDDAPVGELAQHLVGDAVRAQMGAHRDHPADPAPQLGEDLRRLQREEASDAVADQLVAVHVQFQQVLCVEARPFGDESISGTGQVLVGVTGGETDVGRCGAALHERRNQEIVVLDAPGTGVEEGPARALVLPEPVDVQALCTSSSRRRRRDGRAARSHPRSICGDHGIGGRLWVGDLNRPTTEGLGDPGDRGLLEHLTHDEIPALVLQRVDLLAHPCDGLGHEQRVATGCVEVLVAADPLVLEDIAPQGRDPLLQPPWGAASGCSSDS